MKIHAHAARHAVARAALLLVAATAAGSAARAATTLHVPQDVATIQGAIELAEAGDTVLVAPGTYYENLDFMGKAITVVSARGPALTVIDGQRRHAVVRFQNGETRASILDGFTLQHGDGAADWPGVGGGVAVVEASPTIRNNIVQANSACNGNGIGSYFGSPLITRNQVIDNVNLTCFGGTVGGGISIGGASSAVVTDNQILRNHTDLEGGGIGMNAAGTPYIARNVIAGNDAGSYGGGVGTMNDSQPTFVDNLVQGNTSPNGGGMALFSGAGTYVNNTIVDNTGSGHGTQLWTGSSAYTITNNIVRGPAGKAAVWCDTTYDSQSPRFVRNDIWTTRSKPMAGACAGHVGRNGNIAVDPLFVGGGTDWTAFRLQPGSPLIDAGAATGVAGKKDQAGTARVVDGNGDGAAVTDIGALEFQAP